MISRPFHFFKSWFQLDLLLHVFFNWDLKVYSFPKSSKNWASPLRPPCFSLRLSFSPSSISSFLFCNYVVLFPSLALSALSSLHQWAAKLTAGRRSLRLGPIRGHFWMMSFWPLVHRWPGCWLWLWSSHGQESPSSSLICSTIKLWQVTRVILGVFLFNLFKDFS